jgi:PRTRC genetic system ThiF family protein
MKVHYTDNYLLNPPHLITVNLIGLGGTGSQVLTNLARMNEALISFGHPGMHVYSWDGDRVSSANIGRQLFSSADIGLNKAMVLTGRINRFFGYSWEAKPHNFKGQRRANITISCVDTASARVEIAATFKDVRNSDEPTLKNKYWLDLGNDKKTGQAVLGTVCDKIVQPKGQYQTSRRLRNVIELFPALKKMIEKDEGPSCSLAQAINRQDLFINSTLAQFGTNLLWKLFREGMIKYHGCYVNLDSFIVNPIKIQ